MNDWFLPAFRTGSVKIHLAMWILASCQCYCCCCGVWRWRCLVRIKAASCCHKTNVLHANQRDWRRAQINLSNEKCFGGYSVFVHRSLFVTPDVSVKNQRSCVSAIIASSIHFWREVEWDGGMNADYSLNVIKYFVISAFKSKRFSSNIRLGCASFFSC